MKILTELEVEKLTLAERKRRTKKLREMIKQEELRFFFNFHMKSNNGIKSLSNKISKNESELNILQRELLKLDR